MTDQTVLRLFRAGSRGSPLALAQTDLVFSQLRGYFPGIRLETKIIKTTGDKVQDVPAGQIGLKGLFVKEIEEALLREEIDLAVHSLKDLPSELPQGLGLSAVLKREDPCDCLISLEGYTLETLPAGARVGTSSLRRKSQALSLRKDLRVEDLRGNLDTRVRKLKEGAFEAILVSWAGMKRLKESGRLLPGFDSGLVIYKISVTQMLPAVGQGCIAVETRTSDSETQSLVKDLNDEGSRTCSLCERSLLATLQGGCQVPLGGVARIEDGKIILEAAISSLSGDKVIQERASGELSRAEELGRELGEKILKRGGKEILETVRR